MSKQLLSIGVLCVTALLLLAAAVVPSGGQFAIRDQNFQLITVTGQQGSSSVYVIDNRLGRMVILQPDARNPSVYRPVAVKDMGDLFKAR